MNRLSGILFGVMQRIAVLCCVLCIIMTSCQEDILSNDSTQQLTFSHDSLLFDTVFTTFGSSTKRMMVYNPNKNALLIDRVEMKSGKSFFINLDGENQLENLLWTLCLNIALLLLMLYKILPYFYLNLHTPKLQPVFLFALQ